MEVGSQLVAHFAEELAPAALQKAVGDLLAGALGSASLAQMSLNVARGASTVVYITFTSFKEAESAAVVQMIEGLQAKGATLTYLSGNEGTSGVLKPQAGDLPLTIFFLDKIYAHVLLHEREVRG